ncbi:hypothetical protein [Flavobacterium agrisoli]|uniref:Outer membrane insertion C-signal n=1 Tax=Flavobacterium agrisoli TaxID=2793066 RepID=A0A934PKL7_9FLAO|nr:hypothetical protein [Flavobacterium agrisoli]MBK0368480.1 hypothetical protein [Flavobacterium agrisoli]
MKKLALLFCFFFTMQMVSAQEVGVRFGSGSGGDFAVDGVFGLGKFSRIHADVSFGDGGVGIDALWDFLYRPLGGEAFNWYVGVGPSMNIDDPFWLGVSGEIGLEYRFKQVPIVLGVDWRPTFWIIDDTDFSADGFGINIRYNFGK